nr:tRNA lysidine(34) synthetase TilS [Fertoeibacter niger]
MLAARDAFPTQGHETVAVAVSGGGDSIALLHLMHRAAPHAGCSVCAMTVDHGLRAESAAEADGVARFCATLGIAHRTLRWDHGAIAGNLMDEARKARKRLMADWAAAHGISRIALGHTADDAAETFLMGLARASGLDGLAGMRHLWREDGVQWVRPLLGHSRAELRNYLRRHGISWVDDPTNEDDTYTRIKARRALVALAPLGITVKSLTQTMENLSLARHALRDTLHAAVRAHVTVSAAGAVEIGRAAFDALPIDLQRRFLQAAIGWLSGDVYPPRSAKQATLVLALRQGRDATLNGCRFRSTSDAIQILREPKAVASLTGDTVALWDNRWRLDGPHAPGLVVRALGTDGLGQCKDWRHTGLSRDVLLVTPGVWQGETLLAAPLAGLENGWKARIVAPFASFVLSH